MTKKKKSEETDTAIPIWAKLAPVETKSLSKEGKGSLDRVKKRNRPDSRYSPKGKPALVELAWDIPMSKALPIQVKIDDIQQPFSLLDTTPADPGILE